MLGRLSFFIPQQQHIAMEIVFFCSRWRSQKMIFAWKAPNYGKWERAGTHSFVATRCPCTHTPTLTHTHTHSLSFSSFTIITTAINVYCFRFILFLRNETEKKLGGKNFLWKGPQRFALNGKPEKGEEIMNDLFWTFDFSQKNMLMKIFLSFLNEDYSITFSHS